MKQKNRFIYFLIPSLTQYVKNSCTLVLLLVSLLSCLGNENVDEEKGANSVSAQNNNTAAGSGFTCVVDGVAVNGSAIDEMQLQNTAFIYPDDAGGKRLLFFLVPSNYSAKTKTGFIFKMRCPDLTGTYVKAGMDDRKNKCHITLSFSGGVRPSYLEDSVTLTITSITSSRLTGTFSERLTDASLRTHIMVADGKFDIPFSTGNLRPE